MIVSWMCGQCGWMNDNDIGTCHRCGGDEDDRGRIKVKADPDKIRRFDLVAKIRSDAKASS